MSDDEATKPPTSDAAAGSSEAAPPPEPSGDAVFDALWKRVLEAWDDEKAHAALLDHAIRAQKLPDAAGRYRAMKEDPARAARAQKKLDAIVLAATQMLFAMKTPEVKPTPWPLTLAAAVFFVLVFTWLSWKLFVRR